MAAKLKTFYRLSAIAAALLFSSAAMAATTLTTFGPGPAMAVNRILGAQHPSVLCLVPAGSSLTYQLKVEAVPTNGNGTLPPSVVWYPLDATDVGLTASKNEELKSQIWGIRANITAYSNGSVTCEVAQ